ncbi:MAG: 30S ribosomal protein S12 methylthiotransferase RimO [Lachnospiraceae bacterium]|nr:30S ribosomal protein S12 methylthiotransferase RimO [Lachnospiraceae bacterium]
MKVFFISLGCDKNLVDSENMLGMLTEQGVTVTNQEQEADVIIVNTCCFIGDAKEESINTILEMAEYKKSGNLKGLIAAGCLAQRYCEEIKREIPEVDAILGTNSWDEVYQAVRQVLEGKKYENVKPLTSIPQFSEHRIVTTGGHYAHLKIAEGCNKRCTYCIIPQIRGEYRSVPIEELAAQARRLGDAGVKELILVAQETTLYGVDLYGKKSLGRLLDELNKIPGIYWIRILYCYPEEIDDELMDAIIRNKKVCHYLDMPIQHASDGILKRMGRRTCKKDIAAAVEKLRERIPDICLRTTLICGFPGETQEEHEELLAFVNDMEFDRLGAFAYSPEEGTPAETFPDQVEEEVKLTWQEEAMELQQEISYDKNQELLGREFLAFVEGKVAEENAYIARTYRDAPDVDGYVFIQTEETLITGDFVKVKITGAYEYDLIGEIVK